MKGFTVMYSLTGEQKRMNSCFLPLGFRHEQLYWRKSGELFHSWRGIVCYWGEIVHSWWGIIHFWKGNCSSLKGNCSFLKGIVYLWRGMICFWRGIVLYLWRGIAHFWRGIVHLSLKEKYSFLKGNCSSPKKPWNMAVHLFAGCLVYHWCVHNFPSTIPCSPPAVPPSLSCELWMGVNRDSTLCKH